MRGLVIVDPFALLVPIPDRRVPVEGDGSNGAHAMMGIRGSSLESKGTRGNYSHMTLLILRTLDSLRDIRGLVSFIINIDNAFRACKCPVGIFKGARG